MLLNFKQFNESITRFDKNSANVGEIYFGEFGYEQSTVYFYQVVKTSATGCVVREVKAKMVGGYVEPIFGDFVGDEIRTKYKDFSSELVLQTSKIPYPLYLWKGQKMQSDTAYR